MINSLYTIIISVASALGGGFSGWFFTRKKYNTEVDSNMIKNLLSSLAFYKETIEYNDKRLNTLIEKIEKAEARNELLEGEIRCLRERMFTIMEQVCINFTCTLRKRNFDLFKDDNNNKKNLQKA